MPYTYTMDETYPDGSLDAATLDTIIQNIVKMYNERFEDVLLDGDADDDPWVLKAALTGEVTGLKRYIPFMRFYDGSGVVATNLKMTSGAGAGMFGEFEYLADVDVPVGCVITSIQLIAKLNNGQDANLYLKNVAPGSTTSTPTTDSTLFCAANGNGLFNIYSSAPLTITVAEAFYFLNLVTNSSSDIIMGVVITFDRATHLLG